MSLVEEIWLTMATNADDRSQNKSRKRKRKEDTAVKAAIQHYDVFYNQPPPGLVQEDKEKPEDSIPDLPENQKAREFLAKAPTKGLWMPLGKEVKVMKCWRCKSYGHRTGDKECPLFITGNTVSEKFRFVHEDPMHDFIKENRKMEREMRIRQLQALLESSTSESENDSSGDRKTKHKHHKDKKHKNRETKKCKRKTKKRKHKHKKST